ncbi:hypothetical protein MTO96_020620 [Rhipicephalus appendiculatus]
MRPLAAPAISAPCVPVRIRRRPWFGCQTKAALLRLPLTVAGRCARIHPVAAAAEKCSEDPRSTEKENNEQRLVIRCRHLLPAAVEMRASYLYAGDSAQAATGEKNIWENWPLSTRYAFLTAFQRPIAALEILDARTRGSRQALFSPLSAANRHQPPAEEHDA